MHAHEPDCKTGEAGSGAQCLSVQSMKARALAARAAREAALEEEEKKRRSAAQAKLAELETRIARRCAVLSCCWGSLTLGGLRHHLHSLLLPQADLTRGRQPALWQGVSSGAYGSLGQRQMELGLLGV